MTPQTPLRAVRVHANAREFKLHALLLLVGRNSRSNKSCLFLLKAMYVMGNLSDIMDLLILWRLDALFGCGGANSEVDAWSGER